MGASERALANQNWSTEDSNKRLFFGLCVDSHFMRFKKTKKQASMELSTTENMLLNRYYFVKYF